MVLVYVNKNVPVVLANLTMIVASLACPFTCMITVTYSTPGLLWPQSLHTGWYNTGIPKMWTDVRKTSLYGL